MPRSIRAGFFCLSIFLCLAGCNERMTYMEALQVQRLEKQNLSDLQSEKDARIRQEENSYTEEREALSSQLAQNLKSNPRMEAIVSKANVDAESISVNTQATLESFAKEVIAAMNKSSTATPTNKRLAELVASGAEANELRAFAEEQGIEIHRNAKASLAEIEKSTQDALARLNLQIRKEYDEAIVKLDSKKAENIKSHEQTYEKLLREQSEKVSRIGDLVESLSP